MKELLKIYEPDKVVFYLATGAFAAYVSVGAYTIAFTSVLLLAGVWVLGHTANYFITKKVLEEIEKK